MFKKQPVCNGLSLRQTRKRLQHNSNNKFSKKNNVKKLWNDFSGMIFLSKAMQISKLFPSVNQMLFQFSFEKQFMLLRPILMRYDIYKKSIQKFLTELSKISFWKVIKGKGFHPPFLLSFIFPVANYQVKSPRGVVATSNIRG